MKPTVKQVSLADFPFINKVVEEVKVLKNDIPLIENLLEKLFNYGKPLTLKIEGELEEAKPKSKIGASPFADNPEEVGTIISGFIPGLGMVRMIDKPAELVEDKNEISSLLSEVIGEQLVYKIIGLILTEKRERLVNCLAKLLEYGIEVEE